MQGPAVHYNIGVAAYRGGDFKRADLAFREVAKTAAMAALAYYNLGLVALKQDDEKAARGWFERAAREASDERLATLAARRLEEMAVAPAADPWSIYARGGVGHDDNVALRSESIDIPGSGDGDTFAELLVAGSYSFAPLWRADAAAGLLRYSSLDEFDQTTLSLGAALRIPFDSGYVELGGYATQLSLGGDVYERSAAAVVRAARTFAQRGTARALLRVSSIDGEGDFSGLSGARSELALQYEWGWNSMNFVAHGRAEINDSDDEAFASHWYELGGEARWALTPLWSVNAGAFWRRTRHPAQETLPAWSDRRVDFQVEAIRTLWKNAQVSVRYEHERNESPVESYDYARGRVAASIEIWR